MYLAHSLEPISVECNKLISIMNKFMFNLNLMILMTQPKRHNVIKMKKPRNRLKCIVYKINVNAIY